MLWSTLAVELTLRWNGVSGVYGISSTGQVIPFVVGVGILVTVIWKVFRRKENVR
jgi:hypothetical protein